MPDITEACCRKSTVKIFAFHRATNVARKAINRTAKRHRKTERSEHSVKDCNVFIA